jgi:hypothetical protein
MVSTLQQFCVMGSTTVEPMKWPDSSGRWKPRTVVLSGDPRHRQPPRPDSVVVRTNLDLIAQLEDPRNFVVAVVLAGAFAKDRELASFLVESYPGIQVIDGTNDPDSDPYLPSYG